MGKFRNRFPTRGEREIKMRRRLWIFFRDHDLPVPESPDSTFAKYVLKLYKPYFKELSKLSSKVTNAHADLVLMECEVLEKVSEINFNRETEGRQKFKQQIRNRFRKEVNEDLFKYYSEFVLGSLFILCISYIFYVPESLFALITLLSFCVCVTILIRILIKEVQLLRILRSELTKFLDSYSPEYFEKKQQELSLMVEQLKKEHEFAVNEMTEYKALVKPKLSSILQDEFLNFVLGERFYNSTEWRSLRIKVLERKKNICVGCGAKNNLTVDHKKPRSKFPHKALEYNNLQILCRSCNSAKGAKIINQKTN